MMLIDPWRERTGRILWRPHWLLWLHAANTLPKPERLLAYRDIMLMTDLDWDLVRRKAARERGRARLDMAPQCGPDMRTPPALKTEGVQTDGWLIGR